MSKDLRKGIRIIGCVLGLLMIALGVFLLADERKYGELKFMETVRYAGYITIGIVFLFYPVFRKKNNA